MRALAGALALVLVVLPANAEACQSLNAQLSFCGDTRTWTLRDSPNPGVAGAYRRGLTFRLSFLHGDAGTNYNDNEVTLLARQLQTYADYMGVGADQIPILKRDAVRLGKIDGRRLVFGIRVDGQPFVVAVSVFVGPEDNLQVLTVDAGKTFSRRHESWHGQALSQTRFRLAR